MIGKKASAKVVRKAEQVSGKTLSKLTTWEQAFDILMDGYEYEVHTHCEKDGDYTSIRLLADGTVKESFMLPNELVYDGRRVDWDWNLIYKTICEYLTKKHHARPKKLKSIDRAALKKEIKNLAVLIKTSVGAEKRKYIKEYNDASKLLESIPVHTEPEVPRIDVVALRRRRGNLVVRIGNAKRSGKDYSALQQELDEIRRVLAQARQSK